MAAKYPEEVMPQWASVFRADALKGKVCLVTGGGSGICFRIVEGFLRHGAKVAICSRNLEKCQVAARKLSSGTGGVCIALQCDVRSDSDIERCVSEVRAHSQLGDIDVLVNGAAGNFLSPAEKLSNNGFRRVIEIDTIGTFVMTKTVFNACMKRRGGRIINISALLHWNGEPYQVHSGSAKAAIEGMSAHLSNEWGRYGVTVNNIAPGAIEDTEGYRRLGGFLSQSVRDELAEAIPVGRMGHTKDIADAAVFMASDAAAYINGHTLVVDGGAWRTTGGMVHRILRKQKSIAVPRGTGDVNNNNRRSKL